MQVFDWLNCHFLGIRYRAMLGRRMVALTTVGAIAAVLLGAGGPLLRSSGFGGVTALALSSGAYAVAIAAGIWWCPGVAGLTRAQLLQGMSSLRGGRRQALSL